MVVVGVALLTLGFFLLTRFGRGASLALLMADMALMGVGMGLTMLTILIAVQAVVAKEQLGIATSLSMFARSIGGAIGVAVMGTVLATSLAASVQALQLPAVDPNLMMTPESRATIPLETLVALEAALASSLHGVFWLGTVVAAVALVAAFWLPRRLEGH
jgi:hypothetical protein